MADPTVSSPYNPYGSQSRYDAIAPARRMMDIEPSDTDALPNVIKALRIFNQSDQTVLVTFVTVENDIVRLPCPPGVIREDVQISRVMATGTSPDAIMHGYFD